MSTPPAPVVVAWPAEVTTEAVAGLEKETTAALGVGSKALVVDLGRTTFLSSGGLGLLVRTGKQLAEQGGGLAVARPQAAVGRLLRAVGLDAVIPAFGSLDAASAYLARPPRR